MTGLRSLSDSLLSARRAIDDFSSLTLVRDFEWAEKEQKWTLCVDVQIEHPSTTVPARTRWWFHVEERYPWGSIEVFPDAAEGITDTFPHQNTNSAEKKGTLWRTGDICLREPWSANGRFEADPLGFDGRLRWYFVRLLEWLYSAAAGTLTADGEPFELPQFKSGVDTAAFYEDASRYETWKRTEFIAGLSSVAVLARDPDFVVIEDFNCLNGQTLFASPWNKRIQDVKQHLPGLWIRCPSLPVCPPYRAIQTWGEMRNHFAVAGQDLDGLLKPLLDNFREGLPVFCAFGFPIPEVFGGDAVQMHWQTCRISGLARGEKVRPGFRKGHPDAYWRQDRATILRDADQLQWLRSENWATIRASARGHLPAVLRESSPCIIGAGAVGSQFAELLVRGGVENITIIDDDVYAMENCVRHTLSMPDLQQFKAVRLSARLNGISPFVCAEGFAAKFPSLKNEPLARIDTSALIIDCTGSDDLLAAIGEQSFKQDKWFCSISLGREAKRVYVLSCKSNSLPAGRLLAALSPWVAKDKEEFANRALPREGPGCWHPVFPASSEKLVLHVAAALQHLAGVMQTGLVSPRLAVFENSVTPDGLFAGLTKVADEEIG